MPFSFIITDQQQALSAADRQRAEDLCRSELYPWEDELVQVCLLIIQVPHLDSINEHYVHVRATLASGRTLEAGVTRFSSLAAITVGFHAVANRVAHAVAFEHNWRYRAAASCRRLYERMTHLMRPRTRTVAVDS